MSSVQERIDALLRKKSQLHEQAVRQTIGIMDKCRIEWVQLDNEIRELRESILDLPVLVRGTPGPRVGSYHSATHPCGRVTGAGRSLSNFWAQGENEAIMDNLTRCSACNWTRATAAEMEKIAKS